MLMFIYILNILIIKQTNKEEKTKQNWNNKNVITEINE